MHVSILEILWQQLRKFSHVYFPSWNSTPRSAPHVSTAQLTLGRAQRHPMKWELIELSLFHGMLYPARGFQEYLQVFVLF